MSISESFVFEYSHLKKQSQFANGADRRKILLERILWQHAALSGTKKQSQFKAKLS
jgi:hypothetical protein